MRMRNEKITKLGFERSGFWLDGGWVMMMVVGSEREAMSEKIIKNIKKNEYFIE